MPVQDDQAAFQSWRIPKQITEIQITCDQYPLLSLDQMIDVIVRQGCVRHVACVRYIPSALIQPSTDRAWYVSVNKELHG